MSSSRNPRNNRNSGGWHPPPSKPAPPPPRDTTWRPEPTPVDLDHKTAMEKMARDLAGEIARLQDLKYPIGGSIQCFPPEIVERLDIFFRDGEKCFALFGTSLRSAISAMGFRIPSGTKFFLNRVPNRSGAGWFYRVSVVRPGDDKRVTDRSLPEVPVTPDTVLEMAGITKAEWDALMATSAPSPADELCRLFPTVGAPVAPVAPVESSRWADAADVEGDINERLGGWFAGFACPPPPAGAGSAAPAAAPSS